MRASGAWVFEKVYQVFLHVLGLSLATANLDPDTVQALVLSIPRVYEEQSLHLSPSYAKRRFVAGWEFVTTFSPTRAVVTMSSPPEGGSSQRGKRHNNRPRQNAQEIPSPIDTASLHDYAFTFTQGYDDAVTASFRIEADV